MNATMISRFREKEREREKGNRRGKNLSRSFYLGITLRDRSFWVKSNPLFEARTLVRCGDIILNESRQLSNRRGVKIFSLSLGENRARVLLLHERIKIVFYEVTHDQ